MYVYLLRYIYTYLQVSFFLGSHAQADRQPKIFSGLIIALIPKLLLFLLPTR